MTTAISKLMEKCDLIQSKISEGEYLEIVNLLKEINDAQPPQHDDWYQLMAVLEDEEVVDHLPPSFHYRLENTPAKELPLAMLKLLQQQAALIDRLNVVVLDLSIQLSESKTHNNIHSWYHHD